MNTKSVKVRYVNQCRIGSRIKIGSIHYEIVGANSTGFEVRDGVGSIYTINAKLFGSEILPIRLLKN